MSESDGSKEAPASGRKNVVTGTPWEPIVGYSRAVRVGDHVSVSGTTASDEAGNIVAADDPRGQTEYVLRKIERALGECGAGLSDVIRTRIFVTDIDQWEEIGRVHGEFFRETMPACTMVEVSRLVTPGLLVEIEADAIVQRR